MDITLAVGFIGFLGVVVGAITSGVINYYMNKSSQEHEMAKLQLQREKERQNMLRGKYEMFVEKLAEINALVLMIGIETVETFDKKDFGTLQIIEKQVKTTSLHLIYFPQLNKEYIDYIDSIMELMGYMKGMLVTFDDIEKNKHHKDIILGNCEKYQNKCQEKYQNLINSICDIRDDFI